MKPVPINIFPLGWARWGDWSACTVSCGGGTKKRRRVCDGPNQSACPGYAVDLRQCKGNPCGQGRHKSFPK